MSEQLRHAGAVLSNCAFNLAQRKPGEPLTEADIRALDESRRAWDAALSTHHAAPGALQQEASGDSEDTPCPFCGSVDISDGEILTRHPSGKTVTQSQCNGCGAIGPEAELAPGEVDYGCVKAIAAWKRRASRAAATVPAGGVTDAQLAKAAHDGYDNYWTEDSKGIEAEAWTASAKAVLALTTAARAAEPAGWKLVPIEPTQAMLKAAYDYHGSPAYRDEVRSDEATDAECYRAMLTASPTPPTGTSQGEGTS